MTTTRSCAGTSLAAAALLLLLLCASPAAGTDDVVSYEKYVTLIHDQDGQPGCIGQSTNHVLEILKEMEAPYTPDPSYGFHWYVYYSATENGTDPRVPPDSKMGSYPIMATYGAPPETSYPTNFDVHGANIADTNRHPPSQTAFDEAQAYRLNNDPVFLHNPNVEQSEEWLATKGPLICNDLYPDHTVALIGYDRAAAEFTIVDSANWATPHHAGIKRVPYSYYVSRQPNLSLESVTNRPTPLIHPYTARIRVNHEYKRSYLTVKIGAVGHDPVVVWDRNNLVNFTDHGTDLAIDVPLPSYAAEHWPPSEQNPWYVQVTNHADPAFDLHAFLSEVTLVRRYWLAPFVLSYDAYPQSGLPVQIEPGTTADLTFPRWVEVTSPNGGEHWTGGEYRTITWNQNGLSGRDVRIELVRNNAVAATIASQWPAASGKRDWVVPTDLAPGADYSVRVQSLDDPLLNDSSDGPITILAPAADFTATPTAGLTPLAVQFTDTSTGSPVAWNWTLGDGQTSATQSPSHAYASAGAFTVTLTVTYQDGKSRSITKPGLVTVLGSLDAGFSVGSRIGYAPYTAIFMDETTGNPTSWLWEFGDGDTSTARNPVHTYANPGNYTVRLTASNPFDTKVATKTDYIRVLSLWNGLIRTEAEDYDYDHPVEGVGYHDTTPGNSGGAYRSEDVDIAPISLTVKAGCAVTDIAEGEWTRYWVTSPSAENYTYPLSLHVASWGREQSITVTAGGNAGTEIPLPYTGPEASYANVTSTLRLEPGMNVVRFTYHGDRMAFDYFTLDPSGAPPVPTPGVVVTVPGGIGQPTSVGAAGKFNDVNGNARADFADVVLYFNQMTWIAANEPAGLFDYNANGRIDFADVVWLFNHL